MIEGNTEDEEASVIQLEVKLTQNDEWTFNCGCLKGEPKLSVQMH